MGHIKFLLKFGEESHLKEFAKGSLYCSNAETFWGIEDKQKIKGQGEILEAGSRIFSQNMTFFQKEYLASWDLTSGYGKIKQVLLALAETRRAANSKDEEFHFVGAFILSSQIV